MKLLLDTHLLLWASTGGSAAGDGMPVKAAALIDDEANLLHFSPVSIWEVAIKNGLGRKDFEVDPHVLRRGLLDNGYVELPITSEHAAAVQGLPAIHKDPFDRLLVAQATVEGIVLLTSDARIAEYDGPIQRV